jgi:FkbM family methyltransferase
LPEAVELLRQNLDQNGFTNYEVIQAGVAEQAGTARLATDRGQLRAALTEDENGLTIDLVALDDLRLRPPTVVKIDVEGAESRVLNGMRGLMKERHPTLVVETHGDQLEFVTLILTNAGYSIQNLADRGGMPHLLAT